jgi:phage terminase Nu1 subunit (DNA packaging protein)
LPVLTERELVIAAIQKAGSQKTLAQLFGVSQSAISEWGRARPIPRHVTPRLQAYVSSDSSRIAEGAADTEQGTLESIVSRLTEELPPAIRRLPRSYQHKYRERLKELVDRVERDLIEYSKLLEAEFKSRAKRRR